MKQPSEILEDAIFKGIVFGTHSPHSKPGEIIEGLREDQREALKKLKSDDISSETIRIDSCFNARK